MVFYLTDSLRTCKCMQRWCKLFARENGVSSWKKNERFRSPFFNSIEGLRLRRPLVPFVNNAARKWFPCFRDRHFARTILHVREDHLTSIKIIWTLQFVIMGYDQSTIVPYLHLIWLSSKIRYIGAPCFALKQQKSAYQICSSLLACHRLFHQKHRRKMILIK